MEQMVKPGDVITMSAGCRHTVIADTELKLIEVGKMKIKKEYERWLANAVADTDVAAELKAMDYVEVEDAFYRDLAFGTGGLRGVIGAGTNRMNIYTVAKACLARTSTRM